MRKLIAPLLVILGLGAGVVAPASADVVIRVHGDHGHDHRSHRHHGRYDPFPQPRFTPFGTWPHARHKHRHKRHRLRRGRWVNVCHVHGGRYHCHQVFRPSHRHRRHHHGPVIQFRFGG